MSVDVHRLVLLVIMKPPHADPNHPNHAHYDHEGDDYPEHEQPWEDQWKSTGGIDVDGKMWLTPRMQRNAARLANSWENSDQDQPKP